MTQQAFLNAITVDMAIGQASVLDHEVIRPFEKPYAPEGRLRILFGNLAPKGAGNANLTPSGFIFEYCVEEPP